MWILTAVALAAPLSGDVGGKPFTAVSALATNGSQPGTVMVAVADGKVACGKKPAKMLRAVAMGFEARAGAKAEVLGVMSSGTKGGLAAVDASLVTLPDKVGGVGQIFVTSAASELGMVSGTVDFILCEAIVAYQAPTSAFAVGKQTLGQGEKAFDVQLGLPSEWAFEKNFFDAPEYKAPDQVTRFTLGSTCGGGCDPALWEQNAQAFGPEQVKSWTTESTKAELLRSEAGGPGRWVVLWKSMGGGSPDRYHLQVFRWEPTWSEMVTCQLETDERGKGILEAAEKACLSVEKAK
jgi:hypothetical protein